MVPLGAQVEQRCNLRTIPEGYRRYRCIDRVQVQSGRRVDLHTERHKQEPEVTGQVATHEEDTSIAKAGFDLRRLLRTR